MKKLFALLALIKNYKGAAALNVVFNLFSTVFGLFSLAMLVPFLNLIFFKSKADYELFIQNKPKQFELSGVVIQDYFNYYLADVILKDPVQGKMNALILICVLITAFILLKNFTRYFAYFFLADVRTGVMKDLRNSIYKRMVYLPLAYFSEEKKGDIMSRMTNDVQEVEWTIMTSLEMIFRDPFTIILYLATLLIISPQLTLFVILVLPVSGFIIGRIGKSLKKTSEDGQEQMGQLVSIIEETITGLRIIKAFTAELLAIDKFFKRNESYTRLMRRMYRKRDLASPLSEFMGVMLMITIIWYGGRLILLDENSTLTAATFITYIAIFTQIISPAKSFTVAYYNLQKGNASLERIHKVLSADITIHDPANPKDLPSFENEIVYDKVTFGYQKKTVLKDINLHIRKGQTIALVGSSGSGKSTIINLLPRFYDVNEGRITIDGIDIRDVRLHDLRKLIGVVTQQSILFNDTVAANIAFGKPDASMEEIEKAARVANAHEFIKDLPGGYDYNVGDSGNKLSGGQKQRISIARAVLSNPPILLLDEATSSLDTESEKLVQEALEKLMENRTSLVIAHRLSTIVRSDIIYVIEQGRVVEKGTHQQLLENNNVYKKLYDLQSFE